MGIGAYLQPMADVAFSGPINDHRALITVTKKSPLFNILLV
jgi:hypothetical protein